MPPSGQAALGSKVLMGTVPAEPIAYFGLTCRMAEVVAKKIFEVLGKCREIYEPVKGESHEGER